jgi:hypothetical protein
VLKNAAVPAPEHRQAGQPAAFLPLGRAHGLPRTLRQSKCLRLSLRMPQDSLDGPLRPETQGMLFEHYLFCMAFGYSHADQQAKYFHCLTGPFFVHNAKRWNRNGRGYSSC